MGRKNPYRGDPFTKKAKEAGYSSRAVFKLEEVQRRFRILNGATRVLDLGCSPGSWSRFVVQKIGKKAKLVGVDINEPKFAGIEFIHRSVLDVSAEKLLEVLGGKAEVVLCDMAPLTTGNHLFDHVQQLELARCALELAVEVLMPGGHFVVKVFDGEDAFAFVQSARVHFAKSKRVRPEAVRKPSREFYLVCLGFKA
ncbi:MAG: RlmE family RNA methyltransferase [Proteobacteria bacterium]|jgi:23S rRNA (uridine2552-2'-O)-methyltransferase|nr:RlmE family RNA methyltransferase [Pseudomonadota bacterium]